MKQPHLATTLARLHNTFVTQKPD